jgi:hypothetical protein
VDVGAWRWVGIRAALDGMWVVWVAFSAVWQGWRRDRNRPMRASQRIVSATRCPHSPTRRQIPQLSAHWHAAPETRSSARPSVPISPRFVTGAVVVRQSPCVAGRKADCRLSLHQTAPEGGRRGARVQSQSTKMIRDRVSATGPHLRTNAHIQQPVVFDCADYPVGVRLRLPTAPRCDALLEHLDPR